MVQPDRPVGAGHLVPQVHPAAERPAHLELADRPRFEPDERDGVVLVRDRVHERVRVAQDLDRPVPLAHEVADDLDAVAAEVDDRAAAGQPAVPEPGAVRPGMGLARPDPRHVADGTRADRRDRLERLGRVAQVLEIAAEDARRLDRRRGSGAPRRPSGRAASCTGSPCRPWRPGRSPPRGGSSAARRRRRPCRDGRSRRRGRSSIPRCPTARPKAAPRSALRE